MDDIVYTFILYTLGAIMFAIAGLIIGIRIERNIKPTWRSHLLDISLFLLGYSFVFKANGM